RAHRGDADDVRALDREVEAGRVVDGARVLVPFGIVRAARVDRRVGQVVGGVAERTDESDVLAVRVLEGAVDGLDRQVLFLPLLRAVLRGPVDAVVGPRVDVE